MNHPKTLAQQGWRQSREELGIVFALTVSVMALYFEIAWHWAVVAAPIIMLALIVVVVVSVETLWLCMLGLECVGRLLGVRKSPLA